MGRLQPQQPRHSYHAAYQTDYSMTYPTTDSTRRRRTFITTTKRSHHENSFIGSSSWILYYSLDNHDHEQANHDDNDVSYLIESSNDPFITVKEERNDVNIKINIDMVVREKRHDHDDMIEKDMIMKNSHHHHSNSNWNVGQSVVLLNIVAVIWGSQHAVIKMVIDDTNDPSTFTLLRFALAAIIASPYTPGLSHHIWGTKNHPIDILSNAKTSSSETAVTSSINGNNNNNDMILPTNDVMDGTYASTTTTTVDMDHSTKNLYDTWRYGIELGIYMFLGFSFQAIGLEYTTAQRSGFLLYLNVKFVPFFARILLGRTISLSTWLSAFTAFIGTGLLAGIITFPMFSIAAADVITTTTTTTTNSWNIGDVWSIAAAMTSAMFILRLERASTVVTNSAELNSACLWIVALLSAIWSFTIHNNHDTSSITLINDDVSSLFLPNYLWNVGINHPLEIIYLGGITTALANFIQTKAQSKISAERASIIYAMDPVYGALFSYWLLNETLNGIEGYIGATLITIAAATNALLDFSTKTNRDDTIIELQSTIKQHE